MRKKALCFIILLFVLLKTTITQPQMIADSFYGSGDYSTAITEYQKIINVKTDLNEQGRNLMRLGTCYYFIGNNDTALYYYFNALSIFEKLENRSRLADVTFNISRIFYYKNDIMNAEKYITYSEMYDNLLGNLSNVTSTLLQKGLILNRQGKSLEAIKAYQLAVPDINTVHSEYKLRYLNNMGLFFSGLNKDSSLYYYIEAEKVSYQVRDSSILYAIFNNIGEGFIYKKKYRIAETYLIKGYNSSVKENDSIQIAIAARHLSNLYDSLKLFEKSLRYLKISQEIESQIFNTEKAKIASELSEKYESDKKDEKIRTQESENKLKTRNLLLSLGGLVLAAALAIISFISYKRKQRANKILQAQKEKIETLNKDLDASNQVKTKLFSVISHDLRSPISSLYAYLQLKTKTTGKTDNVIIEQTEQLLETLEDLLVWSKSQLHQFVPIVQPVWLYDLCNQVMSLTESFTRERQVNITNKIQPDLSISSDPNMLTIILRNLISNAVKYARPHTAIIIDAERRNNDIAVSVSNETDMENASFLSTAAEPMVTSNKSGLGITLVKEFVTKLKGSFSYAVNQNKVTTTITLPV